MADNKLRPMLRKMDLSVTNCIAESITPIVSPATIKLQINQTGTDPLNAHNWMANVTTGFFQPITLLDSRCAVVDWYLCDYYSTAMMLNTSSLGLILNHAAKAVNGPV